MYVKEEWSFVCWIASLSQFVLACFKDPKVGRIKFLAAGCSFMFPNKFPVSKSEPKAACCQRGLLAVWIWGNVDEHSTLGRKHLSWILESGSTPSRSKEPSDLSGGTFSSRACGSISTFWKGGRGCFVLGCLGHQLPHRGACQVVSPLDVSWFKGQKWWPKGLKKVEDVRWCTFPVHQLPDHVQHCVSRYGLLGFTWPCPFLAAGLDC